MITWHHVVVRGTADVTAAFVAGFLAASGEPAACVLSSADVALAPPPLGERLRDLLRAGSHRVLLAPDRIAEPLVRALRERGETVGITLEHCRRIVAARFEFRAELFAESLSEASRAALDVAPPGVQLLDFREQRETHPEGTAVDLYAPVHRYVHRISGRIAGEFSGVLEMHRRLGEIDSMEVGAMDVDIADETSGDPGSEPG